jgi:hypothetical protein
MSAVSNPKKSYDFTLILPPLWDVTRPWTATAYLFEYMRSLGYRVQFCDYNIQLYHRCKEFGCGDWWRSPSHFNAWQTGQLNFLIHLLDLDEIGAEIIGISAGCTNIAFAIELARVLRAKFPHRKIIMGGHEVFLPQEVARVPLDCVNAVCKGEGEHTLRDVMEQGFERLEGVPGLYLPTESGWQLTSERPLIRDLDSLPWLRFDEVDVSLYDRRFLPLVGSRGCINRCNYCYDRYMMQACYRTRSSANQLDELEYLSRRYDVEHFPYNDSLLNGNVRILEERADGILKRGLEVQYGGNMMIRDNMGQELFHKLRRSGFSVGLIGVESGCAATLSDMRKRHTPEQAAEFVRKCHNAGIKTELNFIIGFPTETEEMFEETLCFIRQNRQHIDEVLSATTCNLFPSDLWDERERYNIVTYEEDPRTSWHTRDGSNTYEIRLGRFYRLMNLAGELGLLGKNTMSDAGAAPLDSTSLMDKLVLGYIEYWRGKRDINPEVRASALAAVKPWLRTRRNRKIAQILERFGLLGTAKAVKAKILREKRSTPSR